MGKLSLSQFCLDKVIVRYGLKKIIVEKNTKTHKCIKKESASYRVNVDDIFFRNNDNV